MIVQLNKMMHSLLVSLVCIHIILLLCTQIGGSNCQNRENFNRRGKLISSSEEDEEIILKKNPVIEQKLKSLQKEGPRISPLRLDFTIFNQTFNFGGGDDDDDKLRSSSNLNILPGDPPVQFGPDGDLQDRITAVSFCPSVCSCGFTLANQLEVTCESHFAHNNFPIQALRKDVEILNITPKCPDQEYKRMKRCRKNNLTLGPNFQYLRLLKELRITDSNVPNIGTRTLWGLSGLRLLDLSRNKLSTLVDKNFDGLYSLREIFLDDNEIKSMVSAAFRHVTQLETLSLSNNKLEELAPRVFYKLSELKRLDLSGNPLDHVDGDVFMDVPALEEFRFASTSLRAEQQER